jgi:hypothetical protein
MIGCQTASGVWFPIAYRTYFFTIAGITKSFEFSIMNNVIGFVDVNFEMYSIRHVFGRRSILMIGAAACGLCELASVISYTVQPNSIATGKVLVAFTAIFQFFYNGCVGSASYPVATELGKFSTASLDCRDCDLAGIYPCVAGRILHPLFHQP